jgi:L-alanine-DL-glutamate epimerase-like enolase superfamily enzyme
MQIKKVTAYPLRYQEPNDRLNFRHVTLAKVETDNGLVGWGECISQWPEAALAVKVLIEQGLGPVLLGRDPTENHALFMLLKDHCWWYGDTGMANFAISALDIALWDLKGQALGVPIHKLLGGKVHDRLRACASTHPSKAKLEDLARELQAHVANGYTAVKVGFGKTGEANLGVDPKRDVDYVRIVRETIGDEADFIVDLGKKTHWDRASGIRMSREFEKYRVRWIEDPFAPTNLEAYQSLRHAIQTQVATGEREWTPAGYKRLIDMGVADIYLADPGRVEGITGVKQVIEMTNAAHLFFNPHTWSSAINTMAAVHLTATASNYIVFEMKPVPSPLQYELVTEPIEQRDGWVPVPDKPGLGLEINEAVVHKYLFDTVQH